MKIRASQLGRLMGGFNKPRKPLTLDAKNLITEIYIRDVYGREPIVGSKEMIKGTRCESDSIDILCKNRNKLYVKSNKEYENDHLTGHVDILDGETVIDIKTPYNIWTYAQATESSMYQWQLMGYMYLTGAKQAELIYVLTSAPEDIVYNETRRSAFMLDINIDDPKSMNDLEDDVRKNMIYEDIPIEKRIKSFQIMRDEAKIDLIKEKYELALEYYQLLKKTL